VLLPELLLQSLIDLEVELLESWWKIPLSPLMQR
jgi:hypothetical protein